MRNIFKVTVFSLIAIGCFTLVLNKIQPSLKSQTLNLQAGTFLNQTANFSDFQLTDTNGNPFNKLAFRGHWTLVFFGYSRCPDVCPQTLNNVKKIMESIDKNPIRFVFASISPETDSTKNLDNYLNLFNHNFIGVTGKNSEVKKFMKDLGIFAKQEEQEGIISHTNTLFLISPKGKLSAVFTPPFNTALIKQDLINISKL